MPQTRDSKFPKKIPKKYQEFNRTNYTNVELQFWTKFETWIESHLRFFKDHTEEIISIYIKTYFGNCM